MSSQTPYALRLPTDDHCAEVPEFERLNYFYGQMLGAHDFQVEQAYFREKLKLHNRCLHGYGVVCGLEVEAVPVERPCEEREPELEPDPEQEKLREQYEKLKQRLQEAKEALLKNPDDEEAKKKIEELRAALEALRERFGAGGQGDQSTTYCADRALLRCGLALDCEGNEMVVRRPVTIDLEHCLCEADRKRLRGEPGNLYISICYCEQATDPVRPVLPDFCGATPDCTYGRWRDSFRIQVSCEPPAADERCDSCCDPCADPCLLLAVILDFKPGEPLQPQQIRNDVRRYLATYESTKIAGISWTHGATYSQSEAKSVLGTDDPNGGLEILFSHEVRTETLRPGVVDIRVVAGGKGQAGNVYHMDGEFVDLPAAAYTSRVRYRQSSEETLQPGDRVIIMIRSAFILDACCQPLDGLHVGGRVPLLKDYEHHQKEQPFEGCWAPPSGIAPWTSGNGALGSSFESWFYVS